MKRTPRELPQPSDGLDQIALNRETAQRGEKREAPANEDPQNSHETSWMHWTEQMEPEWTPRLASQNQSVSMRPVSKLQILRSKYQATQSQFGKQHLAQRKVGVNSPYDTVTDGLLKSQRPITKQQPRLISRNLRVPGRTPREQLKFTDPQRLQRARLGRMIEQALKKNDRTRPPTSRGTRAKSQSIKVEMHDEQDFLMSQNEVPPSLVNIPIKEMYREKKKSSASQRRKSVDIDSMIKLNKTGKARAVDLGGEPPFKTSLGNGFLSLFAKDF